MVDEASYGPDYFDSRTGVMRKLGKGEFFDEERGIIRKVGTMADAWTAFKDMIFGDETDQGHEDVEPMAADADKAEAQKSRGDPDREPDHSDSDGFTEPILLSTRVGKRAIRDGQSPAYNELSRKIGNTNAASLRDDARRCAEAGMLRPGELKLLMRDINANVFNQRVSVEKIRRRKEELFVEEPMTKKPKLFRRNMAGERTSVMPAPAIPARLSRRERQAPIEHVKGPPLVIVNLGPRGIHFRSPK
ncbi:MAG: hypothetical protein PHF60_05670 [Candidatus ainarchaeum sp.]|nr:hypothetical protein [Candidatus ainarchaeum sp.]